MKYLYAGSEESVQAEFSGVTIGGQHLVYVRVRVCV